MPICEAYRMDEDSTERLNEIEMMEDEEETKKSRNVEQKVVAFQSFILKFKHIVFCQL